MEILVIEDNAINMKFISEVLSMSGYSVLQADCATRGLEIAREKLPRLIVMDIQMPGMDGITATKLLKEDEKTSHIKILATTAYAMDSDRERILAAGCDGYISKPIKYKEFLASVKSFLPSENQ